ncbi:MAG: family 43 glycosylhydrolase, partial [Chloroflexi bacterium]|nr:family 43 glycosylhydrolase [Chloroflexota bacterium]
HATTADFCTWTTHVPCFYIDPQGWDCGHVFAPYVIEESGRFWMFYTGASIDNTQRIGVAVSDDLFAWKRASVGPVIRPEEYGWAFCPTTRGAACRDPHVVRVGDEYLMYYTAVTKEGRGCVALAASHDLMAWNDRGPAYTAPGLGHCESSNMQQRDGEYVLFFGGHYEYWSYVTADNPYGWPAQDPKPIQKGITAMEVIHKDGSKWLVAYFKKYSMRMFLGILDWTTAEPSIKEIATRRDLEAFRLDAGGPA